MKTQALERVCGPGRSMPHPVVDHEDHVPVDVAPPVRQPAVVEPGPEGEEHEPRDVAGRAGRLPRAEPRRGGGGDTRSRCATGVHRSTVEKTKTPLSFALRARPTKSADDEQVARAVLHDADPRGEDGEPVELRARPVLGVVERVAERGGKQGQDDGGRDPRHRPEQPRGVQGVEKQAERVEEDQGHVVPVHHVDPAQPLVKDPAGDRAQQRRSGPGSGAGPSPRGAARRPSRSPRAPDPGRRGRPARSGRGSRRASGRRRRRARESRS